MREGILRRRLAKECPGSMEKKLLRGFELQGFRVLGLEGFRVFSSFRASGIEGF